MDGFATLGSNAPAKPARRRWWKLAVRLGLFAVVVWLIWTHVSFHEVTQAFVQVKPAYLVPIVVILIPLGLILRSWKWKWLLPAGDHLPLSSFVGAYLIGNLANSLFVGKFGDLVKAKVICDSKIDYGRSVSVVLIDRLLEGSALLLIFAVVLLTSPLPGWAYKLALVAGIAAAGALVTLRLIFHRREWFLKTSGRALRLLPSRIADKLLIALQRLIDGCDVLTDHRRLLVAFLVDLVVWTVDATTALVFLAAFSVHAPWILAAVVLIVVVNFGVLIPISPGSVGVYQLLCVFALSLWGVDRQLAFALGIAMQVIVFIPLYAAGLVAILLMKRSKRSKAVSAAVVS